MKKILILSLIAASALNYSCKKDDIDTFGAERYIYIEYPIDKDTNLPVNDDFNFTFISTKGDLATIDIPLTYSGRMLSEDMEYAVEIDEAQTTLLKETEFVFPKKFVFHKGTHKQNLVITLKRSARVKTSAFKLSFKLVGNANFQATMKNMLTANINVSDIISRPSWWKGDIESSYLGAYSDAKYSLFLKNIYADDYGALTSIEQRIKALEFKDYLEANPSYDGGELITVPVV